MVELTALEPDLDPVQVLGPIAELDPDIAVSYLSTMPARRSWHAPVEVRVAEVMAALSLAADLGSGYGEEHGLRSGLIALKLGQAAGLRDDELRHLYHLSLLRMIGCTADSHEAAQALGDEILVGGASAGLEMGIQREALGWLLREFGRDLPTPGSRRQAIQGFPRPRAPDGGPGARRRVFHR